MGSYDDDPERKRKMADEIIEKLDLREQKVMMSTPTFIGSGEIKKS